MNHLRKSVILELLDRCSLLSLSFWPSFNSRNELCTTPRRREYISLFRFSCPNSDLWNSINVSTENVLSVCVCELGYAYWWIYTVVQGTCGSTHWRSPCYSDSAFCCFVSCSHSRQVFASTFPLQFSFFLGLLSLVSLNY